MQAGWNRYQSGAQIDRHECSGRDDCEHHERRPHTDEPQRRAPHGLGDSAADRVRGTRTTSTIAFTSCTRTMCAPSRIDAVTAAAVPHTRSRRRDVADRGLEKRLARRARQRSAAPARASRGRPAIAAKECSARFANPSPGSSDDPLAADAGSARGGDRAPPVRARTSAGDVVVLRARVHLARPSAVVHQDHRRAAARDDAASARIVRRAR